MNYNVYSRIPNNIFNISNELSDDKLILILHELYLNTSMFKRGSCNTMLDFLIESCGYKVNQKSKKSFTTSLNNLKENNYIYFDSFSSSKMFNVNTESLFIECDFIKLFYSEVEKFKVIDDLRLRTSLLKLYLYLKSKDNNFNNEYQTYSILENNLHISQVKIKEYINKLQEMNLILHYNFSDMKLNKDNKQIIDIDHPIIYVINDEKKDSEEILNLKIEIYKDKLIKDGYNIKFVNTQHFKIHYNDLNSIKLSGVYLIRNLYNNTLKIGICSNLNQRFKEIEGNFKFCGIEPNLKIECFIECVDNYNLEQYLHKEFKELNYQNEWFSIEDINLVLKKVEEFMK